VITHGRPVLVEAALDRVRALAARLGVELVADDADADLAVVLGGDGTMLRALKR
jgi:NAD kinase